MPENVTTVLNLPEAGDISTSDLLYLIQGEGSDRDRKATLESVRDFLQSVFKGVTCTALTVKEGGTLALTVQDSQAGTVTLEVKPYLTQHDKTYRISLSGSLSAIRFAQKCLFEAGLEVAGDATVEGTLKAPILEGTTQGTTASYLLVNSAMTVNDDLDVKGKAMLGTSMLVADPDEQKVEANADMEISGTLAVKSSVSVSGDVSATGTLQGTTLRLPKKGSSPYSSIDSPFYAEKDGNTSPVGPSSGAVAGMISFIRNSGSAQIRVYLGVDPATTNRRYCVLNAGCVGMFICHSTSESGVWWSPMYNATIQLEA